MRIQTSRRLQVLGGLALAFTALGGAYLGYRSYSADGAGEAPAIAGKSEAVRADEALRSLERRVQENPTNTDAHLQLANAYIQKAREYNDPSLYTATDNLLKKAEQLEPQNPEVFATQSMLASARHEFAEALVLGNKALAIDPERGRYWGVVADAQIELGMYEEAITSLQEMVDRRPDFASYSRISYARELYGDTEGAIEAMEWAIEAGSSNPLDLAWAYVQVGNLYLNINNPTSAKDAYAAANVRAEGYHGALAGQARLAAASNDFGAAAKLYEQAFAKVPLSEYAIALGDVYSQMGDDKRAAQQFGLVRAIDQSAGTNGVNTDLELALFDIDHGADVAGALERAKTAHAARPNIHAADALAWAYYRTGDISAARRHADEALRLGTRDPLKLYHAGTIAAAAGEHDRAFAYLEEAVRLNPNFSLLYRDDADRQLTELRQRAQQAR